MSNVVSIISGQALTTSLAIAEGVKNEHSTVIRLIRDNQADFEEFGNIGFEIRKSQSGAGRPTEYAFLNEDQATLLITYMRNNDVVRAFKKTLVKAFRDLRSGNMHQLPSSFADALQLAANLEKEKEQARLERDHAIATKAQIDSNRSATAMARASAEKRRADKLEQQLGNNTNWKAVKAVDWVPVTFEPSRAMWSQLGKYLSRLSLEMGFERKEIEDSSFNTVKSYHIDVITEAYKRIKEDREILSRYRKVRKVA